METKNNPDEIYKIEEWTYGYLTFVGHHFKLGVYTELVVQGFTMVSLSNPPKWCPTEVKTNYVSQR